MPSKHKARREFRRTLADLNIEVVEFHQHRSHEKWTLRNKHGVRCKYNTPISASDHRAELNRLADLKRFARRTQ